MIAATGRTRIQEQKQTALANIQKNKEAALKQLDIEYANWDKAKTSFGYIGITFLTVLFGSIFGNDLIKVFIHYLSHLRGWYTRRISIKKDEKKTNENGDAIVEMSQAYDDELLEERLEKVYFNLVKTNAKRSHEIENNKVGFGMKQI